MYDLVQDDVLSGTIYAIVVAADLYYGNLQYNAMYLTDEDLVRYINNPKKYVHVDIIEDDVWLQSGCQGINWIKL